MIYFGGILFIVKGVVILYILRYIMHTRIHVYTHPRTKDLVHRIFHFFKFDNAFTHTPFLLPASFCHILINKASLPSSRQDTKTHSKIFVPKHRCCNSSSWRNPHVPLFVHILVLIHFYFLYLLLGIFVIFVVDSFSRGAKCILWIYLFDWLIYTEKK